MRVTPARASLRISSRPRTIARLFRRKPPRPLIVEICEAGIGRAAWIERKSHRIEAGALQSLFQVPVGPRSPARSTTCSSMRWGGTALFSTPTNAAITFLPMRRAASISDLH
jgi:hypothetical protein